jgi:hypothetical protein
MKYVTKLDMFALYVSRFLHIGHVYVIINTVSHWNYLFHARESPISLSCLKEVNFLKVNIYSPN